MAAGPAGAGRPRRKRRRRGPEQDLSLSSGSSSGGDSDSASEDAVSIGAKNKGKAKAVEPAPNAKDSSDSDSSSSGSSSEESALFSSSDEDAPTAKRGRLAKRQVKASEGSLRSAAEPGPSGAPAAASGKRRGPSPSPPPGPPPPPPPLALQSSNPPRMTYAPQFTVPGASTADVPAEPNEDDLTFRSWYMESLVSRFSTELDGLRKDPEINKPGGQTRFAVLIEALASGADLFDGEGEWGASREPTFDLYPQKKGRGGQKGLVLEALELKKAAQEADGGGGADADNDAGSTGFGSESDDDAMEAEGEDMGSAGNAQQDEIPGSKSGSSSEADSDGSDDAMEE